MKHFRLEPGTPCHVRTSGDIAWTPHVLKRRLFFVSHGTADGEWTFEYGRYEIRVRSELVQGAAVLVSDPPPAAPAVAGGAVPEGHVLLTRENLRGIASGGGGFTREQLGILGVSWPPAKGWLSQRVGTTMPAATYARLLLLKGIGKKERKQRVRGGAPRA